MMPPHIQASSLEELTTYISSQEDPEKVVNPMKIMFNNQEKVFKPVEQIQAYIDEDASSITTITTINCNGYNNNKQHQQQEQHT